MDFVDSAIFDVRIGNEVDFLTTEKRGSCTDFHRYNAVISGLSVPFPCLPASPSEARRAAGRRAIRGYKLLCFPPNQKGTSYIVTP
jgi:hypothetical protein